MEDERWIDPVYERTSDCIHLSARHFDQAIARADDVTRIAHFHISGHDPQRPDEVYFEAVEGRSAERNRKVS